MARVLYEVRIREEVSPNKWMKKSKFYWSTHPREARQQYDGSGHIMWVQKAGREKLLGIGDFFSMGNRLLKEFAEEGGNTVAVQIREKEKEKVRSKRFHLLKERRNI